MNSAFNEGFANLLLELLTITSDDWSPVCDMEGESYHKTPEVLTRFVHENPSHAILVLWEDEIIEANAEAAGLLGYQDIQELTNRSIESFVTSEHVGNVRNRIALRASGNIPGDSYIYDCIHKNGDIVKIEVSVMPWPAHPPLAIAFLRDVSEMVRTQEALRRAEERYRLLTENASDIIWQLNIDGVCTYVSQAVRSIGYEPEEWIGQCMADLLPEEDRELFWKRFKSDLEYPSIPKRYEARSRSKDGHLKWREVLVDVLMEDGIPVGVQGISRDITERKEVEEALLKAHADIERAYKLQQQFLNSVTHEIRTPLTAISGYAGMVLQGLAGPINEQQASLLRRVLTCSNDLLEMVEGILEVARIKSGAIGLSPKACSPYVIANKAAANVLPQAKRKNLDIIIENTGTDHIAVYDEAKLTIILINLLSNAVKFTKSGEIKIIISCDATGAEIVVIDSGAGMDQQNMESIFDEFQQLECPGKHKPSGFGIGLSIVATMVEAIGAGLIVSSEKGEGAAFTLHVPSLS